MFIIKGEIPSQCNAQTMPDLRAQLGMTITPVVSSLITGCSALSNSV